MCNIVLNGLLLCLLSLSVHAEKVVPKPLTLPYYLSAKEPIDLSQRRGQPVRIRATRTIKVKAGKGHQSKKNWVAIYIGLPVVDEAQDNVKIERIRSNHAQPENIAFSLDGHTLWVEYINVPPGFSDEISITFLVDIYERAIDLDKTISHPYDFDSAIYKQYTHAEIYNGSVLFGGHENFNFKHLQLAKVFPEMKPLLKAQKIYNYLHEELAYGKPCNILDGGKPHCGNYTALFVDFCRSTGVPARRCAGFSFGLPDKKRRVSVSGHNWAEFYVEGIGWVPIDPTIGDKKDSRKQYYFGAVDNARLCISKSGFHNRLPLRYNYSENDELIFTNDAGDFKYFKYRETIQGAFRFQHRYDLPIGISIPDAYGNSLKIISMIGKFTKP